MNESTKLHQLQTKVGAITKDSTAKSGSFSYDYFNINSLLKEIKPLLNEIGLTIIQPFGVLDGKSTLKTVIMDSEDGKEIFRSEVLLPDNIDPQKMGSAITYFRRYSLQSMLLLEAEDDDANSTVTTPAAPAQAAYSKPSTPTELKCDCGGDIEEYSGLSKNGGKPYTKYTCKSCKNVTWKN